MEEKEKKIALYQSRIKLFIITATIQSVIVGIFLIFFHKPAIVIYILGATILVIWLVALLKIISLKKAIKQLK